MSLLRGIGRFLWLIHGALNSHALIVLWDAIALALNLCLVGLKAH